LSGGLSSRELAKRAECSLLKMRLILYEERRAGTVEWDKKRNVWRLTDEAETLIGQRLRELFS
jgi:hypothetical protein